jgi:hypothetical protein
MNIGGPGATILMILAGLSGSGVLSIFNEGKIGPQNVAVMDTFIPPIAGFTLILSSLLVTGIYANMIQSHFAMANEHQP